MSSKSAQKSTPLSKKVIFLVIGFALYFFFFHRSPLVEDGSNPKAWLASPKILSKSVSEKELDHFPADAFNYIAMIDAGSSGCRAHVFRYGLLGESNGPLYILPNHESLKVKPGLSSFKDKPSAAGPSLEGLVSFLKTKVPREQWATTPIYLKATAGMRLVSRTERTAILSSVQQYLGDPALNPFAFHAKDARVISGIEEGAVSE